MNLAAAARRALKSGLSSDSNSSFSQPVPTPNVSRPPDKTSSEATIFAVSTGLRYGNTSTDVTSRSRSVAPATTPRMEKVSSASPALGCLPSSVYGYGDWLSTGKTMWSAIIAE